MAAACRSLRELVLRHVQRLRVRSATSARRPSPAHQRNAGDEHEDEDERREPNRDELRFMRFLR